MMPICRVFAVIGVAGTVTVARFGVAQSPSPTEPQASPTDLPPGHPPVGGRGGPLGADLRKDQNQADPAIAAGTVLVEVRDAGGRAMTAKAVKLEVVRETVSEGKSRADRSAISGKDGSATFTGLVSDSAHSYRIVVDHEGARYMSDPFALRGTAGQRVLLHVYPVTTDINKAIIASMAMVYVEPQEEVFQFQVIINVINLGNMSWAPNDVALGLPVGAKAFTGEGGMGPLKMVSGPDNSARLAGAVSPGEHSVMFRFQVARSNRAAQNMRLELPPHMVECRVMVESAPGMTVAADGFAEPITSRNQEGQRLQILGFRLTQEGQIPPRELNLVLGGLPVSGPGRWVALIAALGIGGLGVAVSVGQRRKPAQGVIGREDVAEARRVLLDEIWELERYRAEGRVGPRTYEQARRELVDALARLESVAQAGKATVKDAS